MGKNLENALINYISNDKYYIFTPGSYNQIYDDVKDILKKIGLDTLILKLDQTIIPLIERQEKATEKFNNKHTNQSLDTKTLEELEKEKNKGII